MATDNPAASPRARFTPWDLWVGLLPALALAPLLLFQAASLWSREHMQFYPLTLAWTALFLVIHRRDIVPTLQPVRRWSGIGLFVAAAVVYLFAVWNFSPWLAHLAAILVFCAWGLGSFGGRAWAGVVAWTLALASTLPWPWGWDQGFMQWLQSLAVWGTTKSLDALAIPCLQNGSLIETQQMSLMSNVVCGGPASVYAFLSFAVLLSITLQRSFLVALATCLFVPLWVLLGHYLTLFGILATQEAIGRDLSSGWDFRMLATAITLVNLLLIYLTSRFFKRLFEPIPVADAEFGPVFAGLNKLFCWPQPDPLEQYEPVDEYEKKHYLKRKQEREAKRKQWTPFDWTTNPKSRWGVRAVAVILLVGAVLPMRVLLSQGFSNLNFGLPRYTTRQAEALLSEESMPGELDGGWKQVGFRIEQRSPRSGMGEYNYNWQYRANERLLVASVDLPFLGWHDPASDRTRQGWKLQATTLHTEGEWPWCEAELENELGGRAYIFYALFDRNAEPFTNVPNQLRDQSTEDATDVAPGHGVQLDTTVTNLVQLVSESGEVMTNAELDEMRALFSDLREHARTALGKK
jgi:hypothetical protein